MPRNLDTRVELLVPIATPALRADLIDTLERCFADNTNAWDLQPGGAWRRLHARRRASPATRSAS